MLASPHLVALREQLSRRLLIDENHACFSLEAAQLEGLLLGMQAGEGVLKYGHSGQPLPRRLVLSAARDSVFYTGATRKALPDCTLQLRDLDCLLEGLHTSLFSAARRDGRVSADCCLSLVTASGRPRRSLDVAFASPAAAKAWHTGLTALLIALRISEEDSDTRSLRRAFGAACARLGTHALQPGLLLPLASMPSVLPLGLSQRLAARGGQLTRALSAAQAQGGLLDSEPPASSPRASPAGGGAGSFLTFPEVLQLIDSARGEERQDIQRLFASLLQPPSQHSQEQGQGQQQQPVLSPAALAAFLRSSQGWEGATEEDALGLCRYWEKAPLLLAEEAGQQAAAAGQQPPPPPLWHDPARLCCLAHLLLQLCHGPSCSPVRPWGHGAAPGSLLD